MAVFQVHLQRKSLHYILCTFLPCVFLILLCYFTHWLKSKKSPQRFALNMLVLGLIMFFHYFSICSTFPVPYLKSMDIFVGICSCFSIISFLETTLIYNNNFYDEMCDFKNKESSQIYPILVHWLEIGIKIGYPVIFTFFLLVFGFLYIRF